ncbi:MAG: hypothetical protein WBO43_12515 [Gemmatimonadota bacterium]|jgi:hypothetical protein
MRYVLAVLATLLILAAWPTDLKAQGRGPGPVVTDSLMDSYVSRLDLTSEQEASLRGILETQSEQAQEMISVARGQGREAMGALRPKLQALQTDNNKQVEALLTEDQIPEYHKIQAEIQEMRRSMRQQRPPR